MRADNCRNLRGTTTTSPTLVPGDGAAMRVGRPVGWSLKLKPTGGPVNLDAIGAETYATVLAFAESPHEPGVLWAGSDDGLLHISKDGGQSWTKITPPDLPEWTLISCIEISPH